ncbi:MAG: sugar phosphate nucleotidyltransferase [Armatimonadota bacterium]|nr:sugar phosphate nucleotidyltransferase [Armatimonadota bacterium]
MKAVVMAGGEGTRLRPLTSGRPKPLVPVANKPVMEHIIDLLRNHGITDIIATLYYLADEIAGYFGDGSDYGVNMAYTVEDTPLGTAGSVKQAEAHLRDGTFIIISGDALTDMDLTAAVHYHKEKGSLATLVLKHVENPLEYGVVITDENGRVTRFLEKPSWSEVFSDTVNTGIYILEPEIFDYMQPGKSYDFSKDLFPLLLEEGKPVYGYIGEGYWCDIGGLDQYQQAVYDSLNGTVNVSLPGEEISPGVWVGAGCEIDPNAEITGPVVIGNNCKIKSGARIGEYSIIGDNCLIESYAQIQRSVIWGNNYIGSNARLSGCIICYRTLIKQSVTVNEGSVIGDRCHLEPTCAVRPGMKIWPDKIIAAGSTVTMSLIWGSKWQGSLFRNLGVTGVANVEITPDFATKLASAYGVSLPKGSTIVVSRDPQKVSRMLKRALIAGLMSVGVNVLDLRSMPLPVSRYTTRTSDAAGGMHVRIAPDDANLAVIEIFDADGVNLSRTAERKLENIFFREDFGRTDLDSVGDMDFGSRALEDYSAAFAKALPPAPGVRRMKIIVDYGFGRLSTVFPAMLGRLGWDAIALNAYSDAKRIPRTLAEKNELLKNLSEIVTTLRADAGVFMHCDGERFTLVDGSGNIVDGAALLALYASLVSDSNSNAVIAVPVTAPSIVDDLIAASGAKAIRTKADPRSLMAAARGGDVTLAGDIDGGFICPEFHPTLDGMFACSKLLELVAASGQSLVSLLSDLPPFWMAQDLVKCPWEQKGKIMRVLLESGSSSSADYTDGVKICHENGWALVLPDPSEPCFHVLAESSSSTSAQSLVDEYTKRIRDIAA